MNVFIIDRNPVVAAQMMADEHINKMITESGQLLSAVFHLLDHPNKDKVYKLAYAQHPCTKWLMDSRYAYIYLCMHVNALIDVYDSHTEESKRKHQNMRKLTNIFCNLDVNLLPDEVVYPYLAFGTDTKTPESKALNDKYKALQSKYTWNEERGVWGTNSMEEAVEAYHNYYRLKIFKTGKYPTWGRYNPEVPDWYYHADTLEELTFDYLDFKTQSL